MGICYFIFIISYNLILSLENFVSYVPVLQGPGSAFIHFQSWILIRIRIKIKSWIRIRIKSKHSIKLCYLKINTDLTVFSGTFFTASNAEYQKH
jgi:hypothetical protein